MILSRSHRLPLEIFLDKLCPVVPVEVLPQHERGLEGLAAHVAVDLAAGRLLSVVPRHDLDKESSVNDCFDKHGGFFSMLMEEFRS